MFYYTKILKCTLEQHETFNLIGNSTFQLLGYTKPPSIYFTVVLQCCRMFRMPPVILCSQKTFSRLRPWRCSESQLCCPPAAWVLGLFHSHWSVKKSQSIVLKIIFHEKMKTKRLERLVKNMLKLELSVF